MRYIVGFALVLPGLMALPVSVSAQAGEGAASSAGLTLHAQHHLPPQLMLRASYFYYFEGSRLERWHPEAFVDPTAKPKATNVDETESSPAPETDEPDLDTQSQRATEERNRKRAIALGVTIPVVVLGVVGVLIGAMVAVPRSFED